MNYGISGKKKMPAYRQLYEQLREDIISGVYACGERLPSKRLVAAEAELSLITVEHAYELLCEEGYAEAKERSGFFAAYREGELYNGVVREHRKPGQPPAYVNTGRDFPFATYARIVRRVLTDYGDRIFTPAQARGTMVLREALAAYLARSRGMHVSVEQIVVGAGSEYFYSLLAQLFAKEKCIAIEDPSYAKIRGVYEANGLSCDPLPMEEEGIASWALAGTKARLLHVTPYDSYPSGITATVGKRTEYVRWAMEREGVIIEDDFDSEYALSSRNLDTVYSTAPDGFVIYLNTFSHTIAPSVRIGYMVLPKSRLAYFEERLGFYSCTVPVLEQYVLAELLDGGEFERHISRVRRRLRKGQPE